MPSAKLKLLQKRTVMWQLLIVLLLLLLRTLLRQVEKLCSALLLEAMALSLDLHSLALGSTHQPWPWAPTWPTAKETLRLVHQMLREWLSPFFCGAHWRLWQIQHAASRL